RTISPAPGTGDMERRPEPPRRLERTGTQPINSVEDRGIVATEQFAPIPRRETPNPPMPAPPKPAVPADNNPSRTQEFQTLPWQKPKVGTERLEPPVAALQPSQRPPQVAPIPPPPPVAAEPVVLDQVMPKTRQSGRVGQTMAIADFGLRVGAFILDFLLMLI